MNLRYYPVCNDEIIDKYGNREPKLGVLVIELMRTMIYSHTFQRCAVKIQIGSKHQQSSVRERWGKGREQISGGNCTWNQILTFPVHIEPNMENMQIVVAEVDSKIALKLKDWFSWLQPTSNIHGIILGSAQINLGKISIGSKAQDVVRTLYQTDADSKLGRKSVGEVAMRLALLRTDSYSARGPS
eukprot:TRINITY_DN10686_c0_g1_i5.p1 TRINITY_DN10686_c0_g1~~TRINITY_DN10686_c0_g1_i5.p1  ORF type:complete len:186 (-),score=8.96 TRINITY_DN10686_c0_g1_i5:83-640(-)